MWRGFWIGLGGTAWTTLITELVPERILSRVFSFDSFGWHALMPVGFAVAAVVATVAPPTTIVAVGAALGFVLWFLPLASRASAPRPEPPTAPGPAGAWHAAAARWASPIIGPSVAPPAQ